MTSLWSLRDSVACRHHRSCSGWTSPLGRWRFCGGRLAPNTRPACDRAGACDHRRGDPTNGPTAAGGLGRHGRPTSSCGAAGRAPRESYEPFSLELQRATQQQSTTIFSISKPLIVIIITIGIIMIIIIISKSKG